MKYNQEIVVHTHHDYHPYLPLAANVRGIWAVHRTVVSRNGWYMTHSCLHAVTHVPSGSAAFSYLGLEHALLVRDQLVCAAPRLDLKVHDRRRIHWLWREYASEIKHERMPTRAPRVPFFVHEGG